MEEPKPGLTSTLVSAAAFFVLAAALAVAAWWLFTVVDVAHESIDQYGPRVAARGARATVGMVLLGVVVVIGAVFFAVVGVLTLWLGAAKFRAKPKPDSSWKDLPYPKS
jgi:hypothetical protein